MHRRALLGLVPAGAAVGFAGVLAGQEVVGVKGGREVVAKPRGLPPLKITDIKTILTAPDRTRLVVVKVLTSKPGLYGGSAAPRSLSGAWRCRPRSTSISSPSSSAAIPTRSRDIWQSSYVSSYLEEGPVLFNAMSGVDMALWDIKGKRADMPVYQLLGGKCRFTAALSAQHQRARRPRGRGPGPRRDGEGLPCASASRSRSPAWPPTSRRVNRDIPPKRAPPRRRPREDLESGQVRAGGPGVRAPPGEGRRRGRDAPRRPRAGFADRGAAAGTWSRTARSSSRNPCRRSRTTTSG